mmetsp:Transcript_6319/g.26237  ORF Transcript_6319/g.26237 Transcript_6319/m.26237 type:complete len:201 (-) Transcript_6319:2762-3364(-)
MQCRPVRTSAASGKGGQQSKHSHQLFWQARLQLALHGFLSAVTLARKHFSHIVLQQRRFAHMRTAGRTAWQQEHHRSPDWAASVADSRGLRADERTRRRGCRRRPAAAASGLDAEAPAGDDALPALPAAAAPRIGSARARLGTATAGLGALESGEAAEWEVTGPSIGSALSEADATATPEGGAGSTPSRGCADCAESADC